MSLTDQQVDLIARRLAARLQGGASAPAPATGGAALPRSATRAAGGEQLGGGVYTTVEAAVEAATIALRRWRETSLEKRKEIIAAIRAAMLAQAENLARAAWEETGLGRYEDKVAKNRLVTLKTPGPEVLEPRTWTGDRGLTLVEWAPFGVIGAITPTTNPTSTIICNTIGMISAGNTVVFNVHPGARSCSMQTVRLINEAIVHAGGPQDVITAVAEPTIESAQQLMRHPGIRLLVVTGGEGVVKAAMQSGKRAVCAGPGNPPVVVDATADIPRAARDIVTGASFDNNIICVDEKEVFVVEAVADELLREMERSGAYLLDDGELRRLEPHLFAERRGPRQAGVINKEWVGKDAGTILSLIGVRRPDVRLAVAQVPADHPLVWTEQLMPVLPVVRVPDVDAGIELAVAAEHGYGHSAAMHSRDIEALSRMARAVDTSIFVKNAPIVAGLGHGGEGFTSFTIASPTGEGLTGPLSFSRQRRCVLVDHFRIV